MSKNLKIIINFLLYFLFGFAIIFYGITHKVVPTVLAETVNVGYVTDKTVIMYENNSAQAMVSLPVNTTINQYLYNILVIQLNNQTIIKDYTYMLELYLPEAKLKNINNIYVVGGNNNGTTCQTIGLDNSNTSYPKIYFKCPVNLSSLTIGLNNDSPATSTESITTGSNFRWSYSYLRYYTEDDDIDLGPVISNATTNTNNIINNNNNNTDNIINNNNNNTDKIIENQNELLGTKCDNLFDYNKTPDENWLGNFTYTVENGVFTFNGTDQNYKYFGYNITLKKGKYYYGGVTNGTGINGLSTMLNANNTNYICNNSLCEVELNSDQTIKFYPFRLGGSSYTANNLIVKPYISQTSQTFCEYGTYSSKLDETTNSINNLDDTLKNDNVDENGISSAFDSFNDYLDENSTITQLITLPITLYTAILNNLNGTCSPFNLGKLYGEDLILPCINISQYLGSALWSMIDVIISGFAVYAIAKKMIKVFNNFSSLKEGDVIDD